MLHFVCRSNVACLIATKRFDGTICQGKTEDSLKSNSQATIETYK